MAACNATISVTATPSAGTEEATYIFSWLRAPGGESGTIGPTKSNIWSWTPAYTGQYVLKVTAQRGTEQATKEMQYVVAFPTVSLTVSPTANVTQASTINVEASRPTTCLHANDVVQYKFLYNRQRPDGGWDGYKTIQSYSTSAKASFVPSADGSYVVQTRAALFSGATILTEGAKASDPIPVQCKNLVGITEFTWRQAEIDPTPNVLEAGKRAIVTAYVTNLASGFLTAVPYEIWIDGILVKSGTRDLSGNTQYPAEFEWQATTGKHYFQAVVNPKNTLTGDCLADNKSKLIELEVPACQRLFSITEVTVGPGTTTATTEILPETRVFARMYLTNWSAQTVTIPYEIWHNGALAKSGSRTLGGGAHDVQELEWISTPGAHAFQAVADPKGTSGDCVDADNTSARVEVKVASCRDKFAATEFTAGPYGSSTQVMAGTVIAAKLYVTNLTSQLATIPWQIWRDGVLVLSGSRDLAGNTQYMAVYEWPAEPGDHNFQGVVNPNNTQLDCAHDNLSKVVTVYVPPVY